jgi:beta propeller repeat protein
MLKRGFLVCAICLVILIVVAYPCAAIKTPEPVVIAKSDSAKFNSIAFDNETVAWIEYGPNTDNMTGSSLHKFDISTGRQETVIVDPSGKFSLDLSGSRYVWSDQRAIFLYDEDEHVLKFLYSNNKQDNPVIDGDRVVWEEKTTNRSFLRMYDISTGEYGDAIKGIGTDTNCLLPAISGDRLVYISMEQGSSAIYLMLYNMTTGEKTNVARLPSTYQPPAIDGNLIVWAESYDEYYSVYMYDIDKQMTSVISPMTGYQMYPDISGDCVVWVYYGQKGEDLENGGSIYLYDSKAENASVISQEGERLDFPRISGDYAVWTDRGENSNDIYLFGIPEEGRAISGGTQNSSFLSSPTPFPTPDTKIRFYSSIKEGEVQWYTLSPSENESQISFELRWNDPDDELSLSVAGPDGSIWCFSDEDDHNDDSCVRMTISGLSTAYSLKKKWTIAVSGESVSEDKSYYDVCWY